MVRIESYLLPHILKIYKEKNPSSGGGEGTAGSRRWSPPGNFLSRCLSCVAFTNFLIKNDDPSYMRDIEWEEWDRRMNKRCIHCGGIRIHDVIKIDCSSLNIGNCWIKINHSRVRLNPSIHAADQLPCVAFHEFSCWIQYDLQVSVCESLGRAAESSPARCWCCCRWVGEPIFPLL